jgi:hypothetical protein
LENYPKRAAGDEESSTIPGITYAARDERCAQKCRIFTIATRFVATPRDLWRNKFSEILKNNPDRCGQIEVHTRYSFHATQ